MQRPAEFPEVIYDAFLRTINGVAFSAREIEVIAGILLGKSTQQIPDILPIVDETDQGMILFGCRLSEKTVSSHIDNIYEKLSPLLMVHKDELRSKTTKRDKIKYVVERSQEHKYLEKYCVALQIENAFLLQLEKIFRKQLNQGQQSAQKKSTIGRCQIHFWGGDLISEDPFYTHLARHLNDRKSKNDQKIITTILKKVTTEKPVNPDKAENPGADYILYIVPEELRDRFNKADDPLIETLFKNTSHSLFLLDHWKNKKQIPDSLKNAGYVRIDKQTPYYESVFEILKKMFPDISIDDAILEFTKARASLIPKKPPFYSNIKAMVGIGLASFGILCGGWILYVSSDNQESSIRSDLVIPDKSSFLERPNLSSQIEQKLAGGNTIKTVALVGIVGMGGVGKTTLARQFGRSHKTSVVWEINAETHGQLIRSFKDLAYSFAKTKEQKDELDFIQAVQNQDEKEKQLLSFVKKHLKTQKQWLLIYDNMNTFSEIKDYFPQDETVWGCGKVIITTRDATFENSAFINPKNVIHLDSLTKGEAFKLFTRILFGCDPDQLSKDKQETATQFLEQIPSFPLDVSTAAYYIKNTQIPYDEYLKKTAGYSQEFEKSQESLVKEVSPYTKTRYGIVALSIQKLIEQNPQFKELLLLISLIDSQNIPKKLLTFYSDEKTIDLFLRQLEKQSLVVNVNNHDQMTEPMISLHRSMQAICLSHLLQSLSPDRKVAMIQSISSSLENYMKKVLDTEDCEKMKTAISHWEAILGHAPLISDTIQGTLKGQLGTIYFYMADYKKAKQNLEESQALLNRDYDQNFERIARGLSDLAEVNQEAGQFDENIALFERSLAIYKKHFPQNHIYIARGLARLGNLYKNINQDEKAINLLEKSLSIYRAYYPESFAQIVWVLTFLGNSYRNLGQYSKAKQLLEESLALYQQKIPENNIGIARMQGVLGRIYIDIGDYKKAEVLLEKSTLIHKKKYSKNHMYVGWSLGILGNCYRCMGQYKKSQKILEDSLRIYQLYSETHLVLARVFWYLGELHSAIGNYNQAHDCCEKSLEIMKERRRNVDPFDISMALRAKGEIYFLQGDYDDAEKYLQESLSILQSKQQPKQYMPLEDLSDLYLKKSEDATVNGDAQQAADHKLKAADYIKQSFEIAQGHLPPDSPHVARIADKMAKLGGDPKLRIPKMPY
ncbi:MAG: tetratricopeptide repeat protein [Alphaproteobacteria bacterium]|nr:tetratricopeptide repeat protein [Alphaproteobacteria bacterium]